MNKVVKAENEKVAALDYANAVERQADGEKRAEIKKAEGIKQAKILSAEGEAEAIKLVNEAANTYFVGNAQLLRKLEALENALSENSKIVIPSGSELVNVFGEMAGVLPLTKPLRQAEGQKHAVGTLAQSFRPTADPLARLPRD
jgi:regulator of protease activity HflC (stomatin/prohibitin superfamily)